MVHLITFQVLPAVYKHFVWTLKQMDMWRKENIPSGVTEVSEIMQRWRQQQHQSNVSTGPLSLDKQQILSTGCKGLSAEPGCFLISPRLTHASSLSMYNLSPGPFLCMFSGSCRTFKAHESSQTTQVTRLSFCSAGLRLRHAAASPQHKAVTLKRTESSLRGDIKSPGHLWTPAILAASKMAERARVSIKLRNDSGR